MKMIVSSFRKTAWIVGLVLTAGTLFTACNKDNDDDNNSVSAGLMAFHLAPDSRTVGFIAGDRPVNSTPLLFNSYSGGYAAIPVGDVVVGAVNAFGGGTIVSENFTFEDNKYYSVFLVGNDPDYDQVIVRDDFESLATSNKAFVRYINAIPDASSPTVMIEVNGTNVINESAAFKNVSSFTAIDPGSVTVTVSNGGTINATRTITLDAQKVYTILLTGKPGGTGDFSIQVKYVQNATVDATAGGAAITTGSIK